jgi:hypothetical protein
MRKQLRKHADHLRGLAAARQPKVATGISLASFAADQPHTYEALAANTRAVLVLSYR